MSIDNPKNITLLPLISLETEQQVLIRDIRNEANVRKWMYTDHLIDLNEHLSWINKLKKDDKQKVFVVLDGKNPLGVVSLSAFDIANRKTDWAFYLTESVRGGIGAAIEYEFINFVFDSLGMEKLNCEVIEGNDTVLKLHKKFLFREEGYRRSNIIKDNARIGIYFLGLTKEDWVLGRKEIKEAYKDIFNKFNISIVWQPDQNKSLNPIDQIEEARARNNLNWMSILRLALEKSPIVAKSIVSDIKHIDREISKITDKLTSDD